jgi:hypothetical protein
MHYARSKLWSFDNDDQWLGLHADIGGAASDVVFTISLRLAKADLTSTTTNSATVGDQQRHPSRIARISYGGFPSSIRINMFHLLCGNHEGSSVFEHLHPKNGYNAAKVCRPTPE